MCQTKVSLGAQLDHLGTLLEGDPHLDWQERGSNREVDFCTNFDHL